MLIIYLPLQLQEKGTVKLRCLCYIDVLTNTLFPGNLDNTRGCKLTKYILLAVYVALLVFCFNYYCSLEDAQMKLPTFRHFKKWMHGDMVFMCPFMLPTCRC